MSGPPPKPLGLRILHGDKKSRTNLVEPLGRPLVDTEPPEWFDPHAVDLWREVLKDLDHADLLKQCDVYVIATFVHAYIAWEKAAQLVARGGPIIKNSENRPVRNPAFAVMRDASNCVRLLGRELGMSPAARTMLAVRPDADAANTVAARYLTGS